MPHHQDNRDLPYSARQMFDLVADIESYPQFLPWNSAARIRSRQTRPDGAEEIAADLVVSFKVFRERFGSRVVLWPAESESGKLKIDTEYLDGPFRHMQSGWTFMDLPDGGCRVEFFVDFEFRNAILQKLIGVVFHEAMSRIVKAFETRANELYG
ncbi:type II toxin-antitoxin system RatA family toxin [Paracoccus onubensis]|uniref:Type II toxin-antitoxin system RatA family toxin n=1 Tax=Paracoccus onubensis TaxID=1675788 RepID=A0A418SQ75_9RHOB|nr:type II toxin-antitoxin system RatA family toxin [Paracoccus onubensis]RJE83115.1 type II toxin-antitoxin system RatA family toxin [Paracoccus onubensis]